MALTFQPNFGQILICEFPTQLTPPEMTKKRPVVCISPKYRNRFGVATIVPLSTTEPMVKSQFDVEVQLSQPIAPNYPALKCWAKCDMLYTFSYSRLSAPTVGKCHGRRQYNFMLLSPGTMCSILTGVLASFGVEGSVMYDNNVYKVFNFPDLEPRELPW